MSQIKVGVKRMTKEAQDNIVKSIVEKRFSALADNANLVKEAAGVGVVAGTTAVGAGLGGLAGAALGKDKYSAGIGAAIGGSIGAGLGVASLPSHNDVTPIDPGGSLVTNWQIPAAAAGATYVKKLRGRNIQTDENVIDGIINHARGMRDKKFKVSLTDKLNGWGASPELKRHIGEYLEASKSKDYKGLINNRVISDSILKGRNGLRAGNRLPISDLGKLKYKVPNLGRITRFTSAIGGGLLGAHGVTNTLSGLMLTGDPWQIGKGVGQTTAAVPLLSAAMKGRMSKGNAITAAAGLAVALGSDALQYTNKGRRKGAVNMVKAKGFLRTLLTNPTAAIVGKLSK